MAGYVEIDHDDISNPYEEGLYEKVGSNYVLTTDTVVAPAKTYYLYDDYDEADEGEDYIPVEVDVGDPVVGYYEYVGEDYVLTTDTVAVSGKEYYEYFDGNSYENPSDYDSRYYIFNEVVTNPSAAGLYEIDSDGIYVLTQDTEYDDEKNYYYPVGSLDRVLVEAEESAPVFDPANVVPTGVPDVPVAYSDPGASNFLYARTRFVENPQAEGLYEVVDGYYVLTQDTSLTRGKAYYKYKVYSDYYVADMTGVTNPAKSLTRYYEVSQGSYVPTQDTAVAVGKTYYRSRADDRTPYLNDPSQGQTPATYEDIPTES